MEVLLLLSSQYRVKTFISLEINCKVNSLRVLKSIILYINDAMFDTIFWKYIKTVLCFLTAVGITAIRKFCKPDCFFNTGLIYPALLLIHGSMTVPEVARYTL